jgi:S1-C subfamily serine protease
MRMLLALLALLALAGRGTGASSGQTGAPVPTAAVPPAAVDLPQTVENVIKEVQPPVVGVESAGLQANDIIVAVNGTTININGDLAGILLPLAPGKQVKVTEQWGTGQQTVTVTLGERPPSSG